MKFRVTDFAYQEGSWSDCSLIVTLDLGVYGETYVSLDYYDEWVYITKGVVDACNGNVRSSVESGNPNLVNDFTGYEMVGSMRFLDGLEGHSYYFTPEFEDAVFEALSEVDAFGVLSAYQDVMLKNEEPVDLDEVVQEAYQRVRRERK